MAAKSPIVDNSDQESLDIFEALLKGDASLITKCVDSGCDVNRPGNDGLTPLCAAIRNGENEIACLLIPYIHLFREEKPVNGSSISSLFCAFLSDDRWHRFNNI
jgi:ankyrin repeat protein